MRLFTDIEKELLKRISDGRGLNLYNLIDPYIEGISFTIDTTSNKLILSFTFENTHDTSLIHLVEERLQKIQSVIIQLVNLIKLFEDKGYIVTTVNPQLIPTSPFTFGRATTNLPTVDYTFPDLRVSKLFINLSATEIFVTPELPKFIADGYITREEIRANRQFNITKRALRVTTAALILSILTFCVNIYFNINKTNENNYYKIENSDIYIREKRKCCNARHHSSYNSSNLNKNITSDTIKNKIHDTRN